MKTEGTIFGANGVRSNARTSGVGGIAPFRSSPPLLPVAFIAGDRCRKLSTPSHTFVLLGGPFLSFHYPPFLFCSIHSYLPSLPFRRRVYCVYGVYVGVVSNINFDRNDDFLPDRSPCIRFRQDIVGIQTEKIAKCDPRVRKLI